jgi:hypothetical protein
VWEKGGNLPCKIREDKPKEKALALTQPSIQRRNEDLLVNPLSDQPYDRVVISVSTYLYAFGSHGGYS